MSKVAAIFITPNPGESLTSVKSIRAIVGRGVEGDRNFKNAGTLSKKSGNDRDITLIEAEAIEALARDYGIELGAHESRRNVLTRGVALNHLVGKEFQVGAVRLLGTQLCEPCGHLEKLTRKGVRAGLIHRGGLCARIVTEGEIQVGDAIRDA